VERKNNFLVIGDRSIGWILGIQQPRENRGTNNKLQKKKSRVTGEKGWSSPGEPKIVYG
jgi:hypothetical protein